MLRNFYLLLGSSRLSSNCLSEILRHVSLYLVEQSSLSGSSGATTFLVVSKFVEGICGDRVSRLEALDHGLDLTQIPIAANASVASACELRAVSGFKDARTSIGDIDRS